MKPLAKKIALVAGGSRGAGRGIALALGDAGATVYVAARSHRNGPPAFDNAPGTVEDTAEEVTARGGLGIPVAADLSEEQQAAGVFRRIEQEQGRLDVLANSCWSANFMPVWMTPFWELSEDIWRETLKTVSTYWWTSVHATRLMGANSGGIIIHVTDNYPQDPHGDRGQILHDLGHESINRLIGSMARAAKKKKVTVVGLNPGFMRTERVLMHMTTEALKKQFRFDLSESPEFIGRAAAALAGDSKVARKTGKLLFAYELAEEYGFTDTDGRIPRFEYNFAS